MLSLMRYCFMVHVLQFNMSLLTSLVLEPRYEKTRPFAYTKTKTQISFAVTAKLISAFVFATKIVQSFYFLNPKFQASSHLLFLCSLVCVGPGRKPRMPVFSQRGSFGIVDQASLKPETSLFKQIKPKALIRLSRCTCSLICGFIVPNRLNQIF